jgi:hypothetical protein
LVGDLGGLIAASGLGTIRPAARVPAQTSREVATLPASIASAATAFLGALNAEEQSRATYAFTDPERQRWHWTTPDRVPRNGLPLSEMEEEPRTRALDLLRASLSEAGVKKALDIMALQRDLGADPEHYYVTIFGEPGGVAAWGWRFEGHHLSHHFTVSGDRVVATPFFLGAWPTVAESGLRAMEREEDAARELVRSLDGSRRDAAVFQTASLTDHVTQNKARVSPLVPVGIEAAEFDADQQALLREIIDTYLGVLPPDVGPAIVTRLEVAGIDTVHFGWSGSSEPIEPHYYRVQGPTFLLEFDNSRNGGTHIHSVWRDFEEDFGGDAIAPG